MISTVDLTSTPLEECNVREVFDCRFSNDRNVISCIASLTWRRQLNVENKQGAIERGNAQVFLDEHTLNSTNLSWDVIGQVILYTLSR